MEEIYRISLQYYGMCRNYKLFGKLGISFLLLGLPFVSYTFYAIIIHGNDSPLHTIIPELIGGIFWALAMRHYDKNLVKKLSLETNSNSSDLAFLKTKYLTKTTKTIGDDLYTSLNNIKSIRDLSKELSYFSTNNFLDSVFNFIYNSDSKNRILSLFIYFISLIALIFAVRPSSTESTYKLIESLSFENIYTYLSSATFFIITGFILFKLAVSFILNILIIPALCFLKHKTSIVNHLVHDLAQYSFNDTSIRLKNKKIETLRFQYDREIS